jgi:hypothetical protein
MALFKVSANPKGGTCFQFVNASSEEEAVEAAKNNPSGWKSPTVKGFDDWNIRAFERR